MTRKRTLTYGLSLIFAAGSILLTILLGHGGYYYAMGALIVAMVLTRIHRPSTVDEREYHQILRVDSFTLGVIFLLLFAAGGLMREYLATGQVSFYYLHQ